MALGVSAPFVILFIIFGAFLERSEFAKFFFDFANSAAGRAKGGPAKAVCACGGITVGVTTITGLALFISAFCLIKPGIYTDLVGFIFFIPVYMSQRREGAGRLGFYKIREKIRLYLTGGE